MEDNTEYEKQTVIRYAQKSIVKLIINDNIVGSGVLIKLGNSYFIATAAHVIKQNHSITLVPEYGKSPIQHFKSFGICEDNDIGFIEIYSEDIYKLSEQIFTALNRISFKMDLSSEFGVFVIGYPSECHTHRNLSHVSEHIFHANTFETVIIPSHNWPSFDDIILEKPMNMNTDLYMDYDPINGIVVLDTVGSNMHTTNLPNLSPPNPEGMSGGGIWSCSCKILKNSGIFSPESYLLGIETSYCKSKNWMRGTRISTWCDLIRNHYSKDKMIMESLDKIEKNEYPPK